MAKEQPYRYVLLCRHARHVDGELIPVKDNNGRWRFPTESVARALSEELTIGNEGLRLAKVVYAPTPESTKTANLLLNRLRGDVRVADEAIPGQPEGPPEDSIEIAAPGWLADSDGRNADSGGWGYVVGKESWNELLPHRLHDTESGAIACIVRALNAFDGGQNALLVVGHQPQMGWVSSYLSDARFTGRNNAVPLAASEIVSLRLRQKGGRWRGRLCWTLAPDDREALEAVSDKVRGKMESAKLLSAVITLVLAALLGVLLDSSRWNSLAAANASVAGMSYSAQAGTQVAFLLLLAALALYLVTMYSYDRLLMPTRFWAEGPPRTHRTSAFQGGRLPSTLQQLADRRTRGWLPRRPPSSSAWVVLRNMQRTWFWLFTPANILVSVALAILAAPLLRLHGWMWAFTGLFALAVVVWAWWFRPVLGSED